MLKAFLEIHVCFYVFQGAKKIIFTACLSGKLKVEFTSPDIISNCPKPFSRAELISQFFCYSNSSKSITCPSGKLKTEFTCPIAKPRAIGHYFLCTLCSLHLLLVLFDAIDKSPGFFYLDLRVIVFWG